MMTMEGLPFSLRRSAKALQMGLDRFPKVLTETGTDQVLDLCRSAERISQYRPEDADSGVALRLRIEAHGRHGGKEQRLAPCVFLPQTLNSSQLNFCSANEI